MGRAAGMRRAVRPWTRLVERVGPGPEPSCWARAMRARWLAVTMHGALSLFLEFWSHHRGWVEESGGWSCRHVIV